jgi:hypothetical protein
VTFRSACILLCSFALAPLASVAQIAPLSADTYVTPGSSVNFGTATTINVGGPNGSSALVQFDLSNLPAGVSIAQATLCVFAGKVGAPGTINVSVANGPWSELTVTGTNAPPVPAAAVASGVPVATANAFFFFDATSAVRNWLSGNAANNGFIITPNDASVNVAFDSKENPTTSHPATLTITLAGPAGATGAQGPAGATGAIGATGVQGPAGPTGAVGATGPQAPAGPTGATGVQGPRGATGTQGATGNQGPQGNAGAKGSTGATGSQGISGAPGAQGPAGTAGTNGVSGYQQVPASASLPASFVGTTTVSCPAPKVVVGGGMSFVTSGVNPGDIANIALVQSYPASNSSWAVWVVSRASVSVSATFYAVCVTSGS